MRATAGDRGEGVAVDPGAGRFQIPNEPSSLPAMTSFPSDENRIVYTPLMSGETVNGTSVPRVVPFTLINDASPSS